MEAAAAAKGDVKILAVTVLTSLDRGDLDDLGFTVDVEKLVLSRARRALEAGCDGVVSSGLEAPMLREFIDHRLLVVTPGIRPVENKPVDDQKRTVDVAQAFANGADYIVVGRPIRDAADPRAAAEAIQQTIAQVLRGSTPSERTAAERPAAARPAAPAHAPHPALDDAAGRTLPAGVPRHARQGRQLPASCA